jgi:hypothetical protein
MAHKDRWLNMPKRWDNDLLQFARLLSEIKGVGLNSKQMEDLGVSMDLEHGRIDELFNRAERIFEEEKDNL